MSKLTESLYVFGKTLVIDIRFLFIFPWSVNYDATSVWLKTNTTHLVPVVVTYDVTNNVYDNLCSQPNTHRKTDLLKYERFLYLFQRICYMPIKYQLLCNWNKNYSDAVC